MASRRWKALERRTAQRLEGQRVLRGADFSKSDVDVILDLHPELKIDAKAYKRFAHHTLMRGIQKLYCKEDSHVPVLVTAEPRQRDPFVTIPLSFFAQLLRDRATVEQWVKRES